MGDQVKNYFNVKANTYNKKSKKGLWNFIKTRECHEVLKNLNISSESVVLDLGAGAGYYAIKIREIYNVNAMAFEFSEAMIEELEKNHIPVTKIDFESDYDFPLYDTAMLLGVLEFMSHPETLIKNLSRNSRTGSQVIVLFPVGGMIGLVYQCIHQYWGCPVNLISEKLLIETFLANGFILEKKSKATFMSKVLRFRFQS